MNPVNKTSFAYLTSQLNGALLITCPDTLSADQLEQNLKFFNPDLSIWTLPDWETLPYDHFSPHHDIISQRIKTLYELTNFNEGVIIVPSPLLCQKLAPVEFIAQSTFQLHSQESVELESLKEKLVKQGYRRTEQVFEHGEFAVRGSIIDIFPMGSRRPFRLELFDDEIESIRHFDPETQRSLDTIQSINLMPAHEFPFDETSITQFRKAWRNEFQGNPLHSPIYNDVSEGILPSGIEYYQPLFFEEMATIFDYLPKNTQVVHLEHPEQSLNHFINEVNVRFEQLRHDVEKPILNPSMLYLKTEEVFRHLKQYKRIDLDIETISVLPDLNVNAKAKNPLAEIESFLDKQNKPVLFTAESLGRREHLQKMLSTFKPEITEGWKNLKTNVCLSVSPLQEGMQTNSFIIIPESILLGEKAKQQSTRREKSAFDPETRVRNLAELTIGSHVVHMDHGIAIYQGLKTLEIDGRKTEFICLEYDEHNKLYVPVTNLDAVSIYRGSDHPTLHILGHDRWKKTKEKAAKKIADVAAELLEIYAKREAEKGFSFKLPESEFSQFSNEFPFEETEDQTRAISEVKNDLLSVKPMDRLICGDVGFGKTEVAMRAAFIAAQNGKQVAILVPTTLLAQQHYESFSDRFASWPIQVEVLSRFRSQKESNDIIANLELGKIDIIIGTHKLLQRDIQFKNLGLLVLDEEHRFGVKQKEKLKALKTHVDILTLTATPIPRTLNMAFSGMRDLSIISTPPAKRLAIKTFVHKYNNAIISEAILREILRGGQVFFLHNDVATIENKAEELRQLIPEARIEIGHGQMRERQLERVMSDFYHRRFHVLVCSTIIETGIDIPTANTIIINRADKFGLAQLHQLRGRVGRSHHQAYAYLLIPDRLTKDAQARLEAISQMETLGSGFMLANQDLEIRGAGELLGDEQSGHIQSIGFNLYHELLERSVKALKQGKIPTLDQEKTFEIDLKTTAIIPDDYIADVQLRLEFYKRLASADTEEALKDLQIEMIDRFGLMPEALKHLFAIHDIRLKAQALGIKRVNVNKKSGQLEFSKSPNINPATIIKLVQMQPDRYQFAGQDKLKFNILEVDPKDPIEILIRLFKKLQ